jgi:hypothetical protein
MRIYINLMDGTNLSLQANPTQTVRELIEMIEMKIRKSAETFTLISCGRSLKEHLTLQECSISEGCRVQIVQRISGGGC